MGNIPNWIPGTGSYELKEITTQDAVLTHIDKGTKYLECTSAGAIAIPSKQAYGEWEFDWYKGADANGIIMKLISDVASATSIGYGLYISNSEFVQFYRSDPGTASLQLTDTSYIDNTTWYRIKITRTLDGEFYTYIKGGAFGVNWTLVDVIGGSGTNPVTDNTYTTSEYFVLDFDSEDRIANIKITNQVLQ